MEILIPGLILVALMAWASTKIKKRAADAFEAEMIETDDYILRKPEGFLHVIGSSSHAFEAYSRESSEEDDSQARRATIEIDILRERPISDLRNAVSEQADSVHVKSESGSVCEIIAVESANQTPVTAFYKMIAVADKIIRLRFAVVASYKNEYEERIDNTLDSFTVRPK